MRSEYELSVFINCPFDVAYRKLFHAIVFTVHDCGYIARSALELTDTSQVRVNKILKIISECRIGIHDISRTELDAKSKLPRFNMPLELGMFLGAKEYGDKLQRRKICLVLDRSRYRYQRFCSDIAGQDIAAHDRKIPTAINGVRDFLRSAAAFENIDSRREQDPSALLDLLRRSSRLLPGPWPVEGQTDLP